MLLHVIAFPELGGVVTLAIAGTWKQLVWRFNEVREPVEVGGLKIAPRKANIAGVVAEDIALASILLVASLFARGQRRVGFETEVKGVRVLGTVFLERS